MDIIIESDLKQWEEQVKSFSCTPFFSSAWIESFKHKNRKPIYLQFVAEGKTLSIAAGLRIEHSNILIKKFFRILFFYSGPAILEAEKELSRRCMTKIIEFSRENGYTHVKFCSYDHPFVIDVKGLPFNPSIQKEYILNMNADMADLKKKMKKRMTEVRAAERNGLSFHESSSAKVLDDLMCLLEETKSIRQAKSYEKYAYFYIPWLTKGILYELIKKRTARMFFVKKQDDILSVSIELVHNNKAYGLFIGTNQVGYRLKANTLLNFKVLEQLKSEGVELYNFGGVPNDPSSKGLAFYKASFGAKEYVCTGGYTCHLQNSFINYLTDAYSRFPELKVKKIIKKKLVGRNYT